MASMREHIHGGLINTHGAPHVIVAVQALLNSVPSSKFLDENGAHRRKCKSLLKCTECAFYRIYDNIRRNGVADPASIIFKWKSISSKMDLTKSRDPHEVVMVLIDVLQMENVYSDPTNPDTLTFHEHEYRGSKIFQIVRRLQVTCPSCDTYQQVQYSSSHKLGVVADLLCSLLEGVWGSGDEPCMQCMTPARIECSFVSLSECFIIHMEECGPQFALPLHMSLPVGDYFLRSLIAESKTNIGKYTFIARSHDGSFKEFNDTKISPVHAPALGTADFLYESKVTLFYERTKAKKELYKVSSLPNVLESNIPEHGFTTRSIGIQTDCKPISVDVGVQTDVAVTPLVSYDLCKDSKKFQFFTGLSREDFTALYNLIGGEEAIQTLKRKYRLDTPKKLRTKGMEKEMFVSAQDQKKHKPKKMRPFKNLRIILDGVSFYTQTPSNFEQQGNTYSAYKSHNVLVSCVGISCNGATIFVSDAMEGSMSDKEVILQSGLLELLSPGDGVMTDRGYELTAELQAIGCEFYKPPTLGDRNGFTAEEEILTKAIASSRIYCEHAIADIKDNRLLQGVIPLTLLPVLSQHVYIAGFLRNFYPSRIQDKNIVIKSKELEEETL